MKINDTIFSPVQILTQEDSNPNTPLTFRALVAEADFVNANGRRYPYSILKEAFDMTNASLASYPGNVGHPDMWDDGDEFDSMGINWKEAFVFEGTKVYGKGQIIRTPKGAALEAVMRSGVAVGFSTRTDAKFEYMEEGGRRIAVINEMTPPYVDAVKRPSVMHTGVMSMESQKGDFNMDPQLVMEELKKLYTAQIDDLNKRLSESRIENSEGQGNLKVLTESFKTLEEAHTSLLKESEKLKLELSEFRKLNESAILDAKLGALTLDHRFAKAIIAEAKNAGVTLETAEKMIPAMTRLVESQAAGSAPRSKGYFNNTTEDDERKKPTPIRENTDPNIEQMAAGLKEMGAI